MRLRWLRWALTDQSGRFGGSVPKAPPPPPPPPAITDPSVQDAAAKAAAQTRRRRGFAANILAERTPGALTTSTQASTNPKQLLGE